MVIEEGNKENSKWVCHDCSCLSCVVCRILFNTWVRERMARLKETAHDHQ